MRFRWTAIFVASFAFAGMAAEPPPPALPDPPAKSGLQPSPEADLKSWQGKWTVTGLFEPTLSQDGKLPAELGLDRRGQVVVIDGNRVLVEGKVVAVLANDLRLPMAEKEVGFQGWRLMMLTLPNGRGVLCSYVIDGDTAELAYTHRCSCHRGSGHIIALTRAKP